MEKIKVGKINENYEIFHPNLIPGAEIKFYELENGDIKLVQKL